MGVTKSIEDSVGGHAPDRNGSRARPTRASTANETTAAPSEPEFNPRALALDILARSKSPNPADAAREMLEVLRGMDPDGLTPPEIWITLKASLFDFVRRIAIHAPPAQQPRGNHALAGRGGTPSKKREGILRRMIERRRLALSGEPHDWRILAACNKEDCLKAALYRYSKADEVKRSGDQIMQLHDMLEEGQTVRDLTDEQLESVFGTVPAGIRSTDDE